MGKREIIALLCLLLWGIGLWLEIPWLPWCYGLLLLPPAIEDGRSGYISDTWSLLLFLCGSTLAWVGGFLLEGLLAAGLTLLMYGILYLVSKKSLGEGDILLATAAAVWLSPAGALLSLWLSAMTALLYVGALAVTGRFSKEIRFAPCIAVGGVVTYGIENTVGLYSLLAGLSFG